MEGPIVPPPTPPDDLAATIYAQLRAIAQNKLAGERGGHTLQATALVNEAYLRLHQQGHSAQSMGDRFYWAAAEAMRRVLIDHARSRGALKRGGGRARTDWERTIQSVADLAEHADPGEIAALDASLERLRTHDPRSADLVQLRFFAGLEVEAAAKMLGISLRTAHREWEYARAWLLRDLRQRGQEP